MTNAQVISNSVRALDPNVAQRKAAVPEESVWVGASAGTGKTKVLVDRLLRLMLPRRDGADGTLPYRILCLTFTKAAASEMAIRIGDRLREWAVQEDENTRESLRRLLGEEPTALQMDRARQLFAEVVDTPGGLKIMTIHAFCQSVLSRFPLEAGVSPHFEVMDEEAAQDLLTRARDAVLAATRKGPDSVLSQAVFTLAAEQNESQFLDTLRDLCSERMQLSRVFENNGVPEKLHERLCHLLGLGGVCAPEQILQEACLDAAFDADGLWRAVRALSRGASKDQAAGVGIQLWLEKDAEERVKDFEPYKYSILTKTTGTMRKLSKGTLEADPESERILAQEAERILEIEDRIKAAQCAALSRDLLMTGKAILERYQDLKVRRGVMDYDDLIGKTLALLDKRENAPWVMFKLDGGIDHILIDEAQDTNPEQWRIIAALSEEFFTGLGTRDDMVRTVFTVGDEKQSIYSFQRAAPEEFDRMQDYFADKLKQAGRALQKEDLNISFRSAESVLKLVDAVFADSEAGRGLGKEVPVHHSFRRGEAGLVELWPLCMEPEKEKDEPWSLPVSVKERISAQAQLADKIADQIAQWLDQKEILESKGRSIEPQDIMVLMRTRTAFVNKLVRALKKRKIPVSGVDRMVLGEQLVIEDLLAIAQFALLPADDLTLACILKTPLLGWSEESLYDLAQGREGTLWDALQADDSAGETVRWLRGLIASAAAEHPFYFFSRILQGPCPAGDDGESGLKAIRKRLGEDALDPLDEFLNAALRYERDHIPTLQGFLTWQKANDITIKRELEEASGHVRIMTVHGSKGLQAPIVFLPDTTRSSQGKSHAVKRLLWPDKSGYELPLWSPRATYNANIYNQALTRVEMSMEEEYNRLLYVALTRAEDRLYVCGTRGKNDPLPQSWYYYVRRGLQSLPDVQKISLGDEQEAVLRLTNPQTKVPEKSKEASRKEKLAREVIEGMEWLRTEPAQEPHPPRPLTPSRPSEPEPAAQSPLAREDTYRFRRGLVTHKLLEYLPDMEETRRKGAAQRFVARQASDLPEDVRAGIVSETLAILEHPDYAALFGPGSMAEVPVTGLLDDGRLISGQIDRLLVTDQEILIVDYKTNRPPPREAKDIPVAYRTQMKAYSDAVAKIYTGRPIRCFLLWTDGPFMSEVPTA